MEAELLFAFVVMIIICLGGMMMMNDDKKKRDQNKDPQSLYKYLIERDIRKTRLKKNNTYS